MGRMGTTPNRGLPYPEGSDAPDVPLAMSNLAGAIDTDLNGLHSAVGTNTSNLATTTTTANNAANQAASNATSINARAILPQIGVGGNISFGTDVAIMLNDNSHVLAMSALDVGGGTFWIGVWVDGQNSLGAIAMTNGAVITRMAADPKALKIELNALGSLFDAVDSTPAGLDPFALRNAGASEYLVTENPDPSNGLPEAIVNNDAVIGALWQEVKDLRRRVKDLEGGA